MDNKRFIKIDKGVKTILNTDKIFPIYGFSWEERLQINKLEIDESVKLYDGVIILRLKDNEKNI